MTPDVALAPAPEDHELVALDAVRPPRAAGPVVPGRRTEGHEHRSDEQLARDGAAGVDVLYRRHHSALYRYCLTLVRQPDEAADAAQSVWVRVFVALADGRTHVMSVRPWLYAIARNECLDRVKAGRAATTVDVDDLEMAGGATPDEELERRGALRSLLGDLGSLSERQRSAIVLREVAGLGTDELARALGTTTARALGLVADARRVLTERRSGRALPCDVARTELTRMRRRSGGLRAHLEDCPSCQTFERRRRGRALSSLGLAPWLALRGVLDRIVTLGPPPPEGPIAKIAVAAALAVGTIGTIDVARPDRPADRRATAPAEHRAAVHRPDATVRTPRPAAAARPAAATRPTARPASTRSVAAPRAHARRRSTARSAPAPAVPAPAAPAPVAAAPAAPPPAAAPRDAARPLDEQVRDLPRVVGRVTDRALARDGGVVPAVREEVLPAVRETVRSVVDTAAVLLPPR